MFTFPVEEEEEKGLLCQILQQEVLLNTYFIVWKQ